ncbi:MAG: hypothetical protein QM726_15085 [Chitinophagaceae bacterium]
MGLTEKRAIKSFQDGPYQTLVKEIDTIAGFPVEFDVKWDTLAEPEYAHMYEEGFTKVYFTPMINAFKGITVDEMGKEALKETLKKVIIKNESGAYYGSTAYAFENGVLTIDHKPFTNIDDISDRSKELEKLLSEKM